MKYGVTSIDYLVRAYQMLEENDPASLFYAAFELRSGIEARLQLYLEVQDHISKKRKKGWRVVDLAKSLERAFDIGETIIRMSISDHESNQKLAVFYYTPVNKQLQKIAQKLGDYLHAQKVFRDKDNPWWAEFRSTLNLAARELSVASKGNLLGSPLVNPQTGHLDVKLEIPFGVDPELYYSMFQNKGEQVVVRVEYLDQIPESIDVELQQTVRWANKQMQPMQ